MGRSAIPATDEEEIPNPTEEGADAQADEQLWDLDLPNEERP